MDGGGDSGRDGGEEEDVGVTPVLRGQLVQEEISAGCPAFHPIHICSLRF